MEKAKEKAEIKKSHTKGKTCTSQRLKFLGGFGAMSVSLFFNFSLGPHDKTPNLMFFFTKSFLNEMVPCWIKMEI